MRPLTKCGCHNKLFIPFGVCMFPVPWPSLFHLVTLMQDTHECAFRFLCHFKHRKNATYYELGENYGQGNGRFHLKLPCISN